MRLTGNTRAEASTRILDDVYCARGVRVLVLMYYFPFLFARETARVRDSIKRPRETSSIILAARAEDPAFRDRNSIARKHGAGVYYGKSVLSRFDGAGYNFRRGVADRRRRAAPRREFPSMKYSHYRRAAATSRASLLFSAVDVRTRAQIASVSSVRYLRVFAPSIFLLSCAK